MDTVESPFCTSIYDNVSFNTAVANIERQSYFELNKDTLSGLILGLRSANERRRYKVTPSLIGNAQT